MFDPSAPVSIVEGIGPAMSETLGASGVGTLLELIHRPAGTIHAAVRSDASLEQVRSWRQMARLLQVYNVTPQWAEALVRGGVTTIDELSRSRFDALGELFAQAVEARVTPDAPSSNALGRMLVGAATLASTGNVSGRVIGPEGVPVPGATVGVGMATTRTGEDGLFRLVGIRLDSPLPLVIRHADYRTLLMDDPPLALNVDVVRMVRFALAQVGDATGAGAGLASRFSELDGDVLPPIQGIPVRTVRLVADLRERDLLLLRSFFQRSDDAELVSRLKAYEDGEIIVHTLRLPRAQLPDDAVLGDHFVVRNRSLVAAQMDEAGVLAYRVGLRTGKRFGPIPAGLNPEELRQAFADRLHFAIAEYRRSRS